MTVGLGQDGDSEMLVVVGVASFKIHLRSITVKEERSFRLEQKGGWSCH